MTNVLYNNATSATLLALNLCVPAGHAWEGNGLEGREFSKQVSFITSHECPESLGISQHAFDSFVRDKILLFLPGIETACSDDFSHFERFTARLTKAGAAAVVKFTWVVNETPGNWYVGCQLPGVREYVRRLCNPATCRTHWRTGVAYMRCWLVHLICCLE
jgi:hypothetical protein